MGLSPTRHGDPTTSSGLRQVEPRSEPVEPPQPSRRPPLHNTPLEFLTENTDNSTRLYRAGDDSGLELLTAFLPDGRVRIADSGAHRFAGMIENGRADLLDIANDEWSELFLHVNPNGQTQFELRGGPYDGHVLTCHSPLSDKTVAK
jgi:hypothetical protein